MNQNKLSSDPMSMILGILALVIVVGGCCCYGLPSIISLVLSIIGLVYANRSLNEYATNPEIYDPTSRSNVYTAKILNIIALVLSSIYALFLIGVLLVYGTIFAGIFNNFNINNRDWNWEEYDENGYYYDESEDSLFIEEESDSLYYYEDSIQVDELKEVN